MWIILVQSVAISSLFMCSPPRAAEIGDMESEEDSFDMALLIQQLILGIVRGDDREKKGDQEKRDVENCSLCAVMQMLKLGRNNVNYKK